MCQLQLSSEFVGKMFVGVRHLATGEGSWSAAGSTPPHTTKISAAPNWARSATSAGSRVLCPVARVETDTSERADGGRTRSVIRELQNIVHGAESKHSVASGPLPMPLARSYALVEPRSMPACATDCRCAQVRFCSRASWLGTSSTRTGFKAGDTARVRNWSPNSNSNFLRVLR